MLQALRSLLHILLGLSLLAALGMAGEPIHLVILHTNDVHGQVLPRRAHWIEDREAWVGGLPRVAAYANQVRAELDGVNEALLLVDAGDWFQGTPEGSIEGGRRFVRAMASVGYDAMCVGNHEFDLGLGNLRGVLHSAQPPAVLANVVVPGTGRTLGGVQPWVLVRKAGLRIALVGLLSPSTPSITHPDARQLEFRDPAQVLGECVEALAGKADLIVPLTHLGIEHDIELARAHPGLPLIVGGHSHTFLREPLMEGETAIVQAGSKAGAVGRIDLWIDPRTHDIQRLEARLVDLYDEPEERWRSRAVELVCGRLARASSALQDEVVGELALAAERGSDYRSSPAGNWIADSMRRVGEADVAVHNRGGIRRALPAGPITRRMLFEMLPFSNTVVLLELTGAELRQALRNAIEDNEHSGVEVSGMRVEVRVDESGHGRLERVWVGEGLLDDEATYRLATNSFLARGGDAYFAHLGEPDTLDSGVLLRECLEQAFLEQPTQTPATDDRYRVLEGDA